MGSDATALQKSSQTRSGGTAKMMPERSTVSESVKTAATVSLTESEIATKCEDLSRRPSILRGDTRTESEMLDDFPWEGHWEVWVMEWGDDAHWVWDDEATPDDDEATLDVEVSNRAG
jgi:hypothetical protein